MTTLAKYYSSNLVGFFSYSREDDADFDEVLSKFRIAIQAELSAQLGRNRDNFRVWQDKFAIPHGALWQQQITDGIKQSTFYIPIITPRVVNSPHCAFEFNSFLAREKELGRDDLVFPILYISVPELEDGTWQESPVLKIVQERQYLDWRDYRPRELNEPEVRTKIIQFCRNISNALRKPWESPEERERRHIAEAEGAALSKVRGPEPEPLLDYGKQQDKRDTVPGSPLGIAQLPKAKAPRTVMMIGGSLAAVILIGALALTLNNGAPSREHAAVTSPPPIAPVKLPTATPMPGSDTRDTAAALVNRPPQGSEWFVDKSKVFLVPAQEGPGRQFYFLVPSEELAKQGVQQGVLLFDGQKVNETYEGKLFVFAGGCQPQPYAASGPITNNSNTVTLIGMAPQVDPKSCRILGKQEKTLIFYHPD